MKPSIRENTEEYVFPYCIIHSKTIFHTMPWKPKKYIRISENSLGKLTEDRIIRQNSLEGVRKSESVNLMCPKTGREWQKQNHSIHLMACFYNFSLNIHCNLLAEIEHLISFGMS